MKQSRVGRPKGENVENANRRRKQLMDAAIQSIVEHGLSATTFATVAEASGLSQGTAVFYFKSKDALLAETFRFRLEEYQAFWQDALASAGSDPVERLVTLTFSTIDSRIMTPLGLKFWNAFWNAASPNASLLALSDQFEAERLQIQVALCEESKDQMDGTFWTPKSVAHALESMSEGIWVRAYYSPDYMSVQDARLAMGTVLCSIFPTYSDSIMKRARECPPREGHQAS